MSATLSLGALLKQAQDAGLTPPPEKMSWCPPPPEDNLRNGMTYGVENRTTGQVRPTPADEGYVRHGPNSSEIEGDSFLKAWRLIHQLHRRHPSEKYRIVYRDYDVWQYSASQPDWA